MAAIIQTRNEEEEELVDLFVECLLQSRPHRNERTDFAKSVLRRALELYSQNKLANVVERKRNSWTDFLHLAVPRDLCHIPGDGNLYNAISGLERGGISSIMEILDLTDAELLSDRFPGLGKQALKRLDERLEELNLKRGVKIKGLEEEPWPE